MTYTLRITQPGYMEDPPEATIVRGMSLGEAKSRCAAELDQTASAFTDDVATIQLASAKENLDKLDDSGGRIGLVGAWLHEIEAE